MRVVDEVVNVLPGDENVFVTNTYWIIVFKGGPTKSITMMTYSVNGLRFLIKLKECTVVRSTSSKSMDHCSVNSI